MAERNGWARIGPREGGQREIMISAEPPWKCEPTKQKPFYLVLNSLQSLDLDLEIERNKEEERTSKESKPRRAAPESCYIPICLKTKRHSFNRSSSIDTTLFDGNKYLPILRPNRAQDVGTAKPSPAQTR